MSPRDQLRAAHARLDAARAAYDAAELAKSRADAVLDAAESELQQFAGLDSAIAEEVGSRVVEWATTGDASPPPSLDSGVDTTTRAAARRSARARRSAARSAVGRLGASLALAAAKVAHARDDVVAAAMALVAENADTVWEKCRRLEEEAAACRIKLHAMQGTAAVLRGRNQNTTLPAAVSLALATPPKNAECADRVWNGWAHHALAAERTRMQSYLGRLISDGADASFFVSDEEAADAD